MKGEVAGVKGLEPSTSAVTGQRSNQLSYTPINGERPDNRCLCSNCKSSPEKKR